MFKIKFQIKITLGSFKWTWSQCKDWHAKIIHYQLFRKQNLLNYCNVHDTINHSNSPKQRKFIVYIWGCHSWQFNCIRKYGDGSSPTTLQILWRKTVAMLVNENSSEPITCEMLGWCTSVPESVTMVCQIFLPDLGTTKATSQERGPPLSCYNKSIYLTIK